MSQEGWEHALDHNRRKCKYSCLRQLATSNRRQDLTSAGYGVGSLNNRAATPIPQPLPHTPDQTLRPTPTVHSRAPVDRLRSLSSSQSFAPSPSGNDNAREETQRSLRSQRVNKAAKAAEIAGTGEVAASTPSKDQCCLANEPPAQNNQALNRKVRFHAPVADRVEEPPKVKSSTQSFVPSPSGNGDDRKKTRNSSTQTPLTPGSKHVSKTTMRVQRNIVQAHAGMGGTGQAKASTLAYLEQSPPAGHRQLHVADPTHHNFGIPL
ncbi:hypothetical protein [Candidatus Regiella endosymbiont of Tuberolachnus salignus]|uniref:hypothetical protein n=1 Tax=Candidatus Regiella endosymbiont of Tuberolachnus salignus TaxID=3077956 RepID=UPI0030CE4079